MLGYLGRTSILAGCLHYDVIIRIWRDELCMNASLTTELSSACRAKTSEMSD
jgi:hypothetical protein